MSQIIPFDKERFLNACSCGCTKSRQVVLDRIDELKDSDPKLVQYLEWYRDDLWNKQVKEEEFRKARHELGDEEQTKQAVAALRAFAAKLEQPGMHFMIHCELPPVPIFSGKDHVEQYHSHIEVHMVAGPLGG